VAQAATDAGQDDLTRIGDALAAVFRAGHARRLHERVAAEAGVAVDRTGFVLLVKLRDGPARISQLAERIGLDVSTTSRKVAELEADGLVVRADDPRDRRAAVVSPSDRAVELIRHLRAVRRRAFERLLAGWDDADRARLADLLERLVADLDRDGYPGDGWGAPGKRVSSPS
jgi:DNA-binding MarR family transcriptional regulator